MEKRNDEGKEAAPLDKKRETLARVLFWAGIILPVLWMLPLFVAAFSAFPAADDFTYALRTHAEWIRSGSLPHVVVDAFRNSLQIYRNWQGTFSGVLVMALGPMAFSWRLYPWHAAALLLFSLLAHILLMRGLALHVSRGKSRFWLPSACVLWALSFMLMPDLREGLYWFNSAWFYTGTQCLAYIAVALLLRQAGAQRFRGAGWIALALMMLWIGLNNYVTAIWCAGLFGMSLLVLLAQKKPAWKGALAVWLVLCVALLCSVLAPGNQERIARDAAAGLQGYPLLEALLHAMGESFAVLRRQVFTTSLWLLGLVAMLWGLARDLPARVRIRHVLMLPVAVGLLLVMMIFPHLYTSGTIGAARVVNLYAQWIGISTLLCGYAMGSVLRRLLHGMGVSWRAARGSAGLLLVLVTVLIAFVQPSGYRGLIRDALAGKMGEYRTGMRLALEQLEQAPENTDVVLTSLPEAPASVGGGFLTDDAGNWINQDVASYFGLQSVRIE